MLTNPPLCGVERCPVSVTLAPVSLKLAECPVSMNLARVSLKLAPSARLSH
jgi:hypothetical protein